LACKVPTVFRQRLGDGELGGDGVEHRVDAGCERTHTGGAGKGDQSDEQRVLDQILTFVTLQVHVRDLQLGDEVLHVVYPLDLYPGQRLGLSRCVANDMPNRDRECRFIIQSLTICTVGDGVNHCIHVKRGTDSLGIHDLKVYYLNGPGANCLQISP